MRVVSLLPSATEIVCAIGGAGDLIGVSHECDYPPVVATLPRLTASRLDPETTASRDIDAAVRGMIRDALSLYTVDAERLAALAPELILTQDLCEVCAVSLDDVKSAVARLANRERIEIVSLRPTRLRQVLDDIERVGTALGRAAAAKRFRGELDDRIFAIAARAAALGSRPRVASIEWVDPPMLGGTWMPDLIALAGGAAVGAKPGAPAPSLRPGDLAALMPEVVVVKPCGFALERALAELPLVLPLVAAECPSARVYVADGNAFFNRSGPRLVESLEILAACIHPAAFADFAAQHRAAFTSVALPPR